MEVMTRAQTTKCEFDLWKLILEASEDAVANRKEVLKIFKKAKAADLPVYQEMNATLVAHAVKIASYKGCCFYHDKRFYLFELCMPIVMYSAAVQR